MQDRPHALLSGMIAAHSSLTSTKPHLSAQCHNHSILSVSVGQMVENWTAGASKIGQWVKSLAVQGDVGPMPELRVEKNQLPKVIL